MLLPPLFTPHGLSFCSYQIRHWCPWPSSKPLLSPGPCDIQNPFMKEGSRSPYHVHPGVLWRISAQTLQVPSMCTAFAHRRHKTFMSVPAGRVPGCLCVDRVLHTPGPSVSRRVRVRDLSAGSGVSGVQVCHKPAICKYHLFITKAMY